MIIDKTWFYDLSWNDKKKIFINTSTDVVFFDDWTFDRKIVLWNNANVTYFILKKKEIKSEIKFYQNEDNSNLLVNYLILAKEKNFIKSKLKAKLKANNCTTNINIFSFLFNYSRVLIDWVIKIKEGIKWLDCNLKEENIIVWKNIRVKASPKLLVDSNDLIASHSCKVEHLDQDKLFYLESRGVDKEDSIKILLESKFNFLFWDIIKEKNLKI